MKKLMSMTAFVLWQIKIKKQTIKECEKFDKGYEYVIDAESRFNENIENYANFIIQKLELWMFVPCKLVDGIWVVLKEPYYKDFYTPMPERNGKKVWLTNRDKFELALKEYQEAKDRCLFYGFELITDKGEFITIQGKSGYLNWNKKDLYFMFYSGFCIERLMESFDLELTPTAQKQIGLC